MGEFEGRNKDRETDKLRKKDKIKDKDGNKVKDKDKVKNKLGKGVLEKGETVDFTPEQKAELTEIAKFAVVQSAEHDLVDASHIQIERKKPYYLPAIIFAVVAIGVLCIVLFQ